MKKIFTKLMITAIFAMFGIAQSQVIQAANFQFYPPSGSTVHKIARIEISDEDGNRVTLNTTVKPIFDGESTGFFYNSTETNSPGRITFSHAASKANGSHNIVIPAGVISTLDGETNDEITLTYTVDTTVAAPDAIVEPESGSTLNEFTAITINYPFISTGYGANGNYPIRIVDINENKIIASTASKEYNSQTGSVYKLTAGYVYASYNGMEATRYTLPTGTILPDGDYKIEFHPYGVYYSNFNNPYTLGQDLVEIPFTIDSNYAAEGETPVFSFTPGLDSTLKYYELQDFTFIAPDGVELQINLECEAPVVKHGNDVISGASFSVSGNVLTVSLPALATAVGNYTISIPKGYVTFTDGEGTTHECTEMNRTYVINSMWFLFDNLTAAEHLSLSQIVLKATGEEEVVHDSGIGGYSMEITYLDNVAEQLVKLTDAEGTEIPCTVREDGADAIISPLTPITTPGVYTLTVPARSFVYYDPSGYGIYAKKQEFTYTVITPAPTPVPFAAAITAPVAIEEGGAYASTGDGDFEFTLEGVADDSVVGYQFTCDKEGDEFINRGSVTFANGKWTGHNSNWTLYEGVNYKIEIAKFESAEDRDLFQNAIESVEYNFTGTTAQAVMSNVKFVSVNPENFSMLEDGQTVITVTWDGPVTVDLEKSGINQGFGMGILPFTSAYCNVENSNCGSVWYLEMDETYLAEVSDVYVVVYATDADGNVVEGNQDLGEYDYLAFEYGTAAGTASVEVALSISNFEIVPELGEIIVSCEGMAVGRNYIMPDDAAYIFDVANENFISFDTVEIVAPEDEESEITTVRMALATPIADAGQYDIYIPEGYFIVGSMENTYASSEVSITVTVQPNQDPDPDPQDPDPSVITIETDPASGSVLTELAEIHITDSRVTWAYDGTPYFKDNSTYSIMPVGFYIGWLTVAKNGEPATITEPGVYTVVLPAGCIKIDDEPTTQDIELVYTISADAETNVVIDIVSPLETGATAKAIDCFSVKFEEVENSLVLPNEDCNDPITIVKKTQPNDYLAYIAASLVAMNRSTYWDEEHGKYVFAPSNVITEEGVYVITIPAKFFKFEPLSRAEGTKYSKEHIIEVTVDANAEKTTGVDFIEAVFNGGNGAVYNLQGIRVLPASNASAIRTLAPGMYIINGKKVVIK